jgi:hypothetical protein
LSSGYQPVVRSTSARAVGYALRELGRRAGVPNSEIERWRYTIRDGRVALYPVPGSDKRVSFPFDSAKPQSAADLMGSPPVWFDDSVVPFNTGKGGGPLFTAGDADEIWCRADVVTATLWTLSRLEERFVSQRDEHGRFQASSSIGHKFDFLDRPIVDEYGVALQRALARLLSGWEGRRPSLRVMLSHDIDLVGLPRRLRATIGHLASRRSPEAFVTDVVSMATGGPTAYLKAATALQRTSKALGLKSAFYWMAASRATEYDSGYDPADPLVLGTIDELRREGAEIGIHPGYDTFGSTDTLADEIGRLANAIGTAEIGGRQHYLRWNPDTWSAWERAGLVYDSSVGFADGVGFRAGTAYPYHPWHIDEDRELALLEVPLVVMDCAPIAYMRLGEAETLSRVCNLVARCSDTGGVFSLLWHNTSIIEQPYARLYPRILEMLAGAQQYDWNVDRELAALPHAVETAAAS